MAQHTNYWSCSKFADWLRGIPKPGSATMEAWDAWRDEATRHHPVRYWLAEEGLRFLQDFVTWPARKIYDIKYYINNRWVTRTHALTAHPRDIPRGEWRDVGSRFLACLFNELQDFVEVELAWWNIAWDSKAKKKYQAPFWARGWFRWRTWRCKEAGLDNLDWQINLKHDEDWIDKDDPKFGKATPQAERAQEIKELYLWWTETYRKRPDPYDASGWTAACEKERLVYGGRQSFSEAKDPALRKERDQTNQLLQEIERKYMEEEEAMMIRLIKIRDSLWT